MSTQSKHIVNQTVGVLGIGCVFLALCCAHAQVTERTLQLVVAVAPGWDSHEATLTCCERKNARSTWRPALKSWPVLLGSKGLAWGRGAFKLSETTADWKKENDRRAPAGIFDFGKIYGYEKSPPRGTKWPYVQVGDCDAWIDDPKLPHYNEHVRIDPQSVPAWFEKQKMRLGDNAYKWLLEIRHNTSPALPGYGSAIFIHVRRGPDKPTAGCTSMALDDLEKLIRWLQPDGHPQYVLLPRLEYEKLRVAWGLP